MEKYDCTTAIKENVSGLRKYTMKYLIAKRVHYLQLNLKGLKKIKQTNRHKNTHTHARAYTQLHQVGQNVDNWQIWVKDIWIPLYYSSNFH